MEAAREAITTLHLQFNSMTYKNIHGQTDIYTEHRT